LGYLQHGPSQCPEEALKWFACGQLAQWQMPPNPTSPEE
jgi:hypothetical protein